MDGIDEIVFLEKGFLKPRRDVRRLRGVELFNLGLLRDFSAAGLGVVVPCHRSWSGLLSETCGGKSATIAIRWHGWPFLGAIVAAFAILARCRGKPARRALVVGNVAKGMMPALGILRRLGSFDKVVMFAHKMPDRKTARKVAGSRCSVLCVNGAIAEGFRMAGTDADIHVDYGIRDGESFHPPAELRQVDGGPMRVCLLGSLRSEWKGADTAIAAMSLLPGAYRGRIELHVMAFPDGRTFPPGSGIVAHPWADFEEVPEWLRGMDAMLALSRAHADGSMTETFSQTAVQGMLTGLPVIHTSLPCYVEKFNEGGGMLADTPQEIADALVRLADAPQLRRCLGLEGRATALKRYVWDTGKFCKLYL